MKKTLISYYLLTLSLTLFSQPFSKSFQSVTEVKPVEYTSPNSTSHIAKEDSLLSNQQNAPLEESKEKSQPLKDVGVSNNTVVKNENKPSSKVELLDWWKSGQFIFSVGTVAEVKDLYTNKVFMVKRTMGDNHADTEALTKKDTNIIKSIWGGFSWDRRPVVLTINNGRYAASMSAMPHAGIDSAPAYALINNRSDGYGRGENLDVIKGNGMDGHFDIHFLNSTRHKDGQKDSQHQAAILEASK